MRYILSCLLVFVSFISNAQQKRPYGIYELELKDSIPKGHAVVYGNFIQRFGFSSGGLAQDIYLYNIDRKTFYAFRAKPALKSKKEHPFCLVLKPGTYVIYTYKWARSTWYGSQSFNEPIYKGIDATDRLNKKLKSGEISKSDLIPFSFTVTENGLFYVGTWNFGNGLVSFSDDKQQLDAKMIKDYKNLEFSNAKISLPN